MPNPSPQSQQSEEEDENKEEGGDENEEGGDENEVEGGDEREEKEAMTDLDNSWNGTGKEETEKRLESYGKRTNETRKMAEDLERDFEKEKEKARQEREEKENIYNAYQELLKRKEKEDGETEAF